MNRIVLLLTLLAAGAFLGGCYNFHAVEEGQIYRSSQPLEEDLTAWIRTYNIKTVLKLNGGNPGDFWFEQTDKLSREHQVRVEVVPMSASRFPSREQLVRVWEVLETAPRPILIHCREGADRTGMVSAISVLHRGDSPEEALKQLAFAPYWHSGLFGTAAMGRTIQLYQPWHPALSFGEWAATYYEMPEDQSEFPGALARQRELASQKLSSSGSSSASASR